MVVSQWVARFTVSILMISALTAVGHADPLDRFYGIFKGATISEDQELKARDLGITISKSGSGFTVEGTTVIYKKSGKEKKVVFTQEFIPSGRPNTYAAAAKKNMFGKMVPLDPLKGEPYVWATLVEDTLKIHALMIPEGGGYELQVFDRTVSEDGQTLELVFSRFRDGEQLRAITGSLKRINHW